MTEENVIEHVNEMCKSQVPVNVIKMRLREEAGNLLFEHLANP